MTTNQFVDMTLVNQKSPDTFRNMLAALGEQASIPHIIYFGTDIVKMLKEKTEYKSDPKSVVAEKFCGVTVIESKILAPNGYAVIDASGNIIAAGKFEKNET